MYTVSITCTLLEYRAFLSSNKILGINGLLLTTKLEVYQVPSSLRNLKSVTWNLEALFSKVLMNCLKSISKILWLRFDASYQIHQKLLFLYQINHTYFAFSPRLTKMNNSFLLDMPQLLEHKQCHNIYVTHNVSSGFMALKLSTHPILGNLTFCLEIRDCKMNHKSTSSIYSSQFLIVFISVINCSESSQ